MNRRAPAWLTVIAATLCAAGCVKPTSGTTAVRVSQMGHVVIGGPLLSIRDLPQRPRVRRTGLPVESVDPNGDFNPDATYVRFILLEAPRHTLPILMLPGGGLSGAVYETTPDGRPGWESFFLRAGYSVFTADLQRTGRSPWARFPEIEPEEPAFRDRAFVWEVFRIGPTGSYGAGMRPFAGTQFPIKAFDAVPQLAAPRFRSSPEAEAATFDALFQRVCPCIVLAHSASGGPALAAAERHPDIVKAVIAVEPSTVPDEPWQGPPTLLVWGDFLTPNETQASWALQMTASQRFAQARLPSATFLHLPAVGIGGNSHLPMSDVNSDVVAAVLDRWILKHKL